MSDTEQPTPDTAPETPVAPPEDTLGDPGKRALDAERKARKAAEKASADLAAKVQQYEDAQKSEAERLTARAEAAEARAATAEAAKVRAEIVNELGIPADIAADIAGNTPEEFRAAAERLKAHLAPAQKFGPVDTGPRNVDDTRPKQLTRADMAGMNPDQIVAAKAAGQFNDLLGIK